MKETRYRVLRRLSEGGCGETYLVWDIRLEQRWVMKRIRLSEEVKRDAATREIAALRQLHKEGIPVLADVFYEEEAVCLIMEYMEGMSLEEKVRREGAMCERDAVSYALQAAELTAFLHERTPKLIHGDLKPLNLIWHNGRAALLDFGGTAAIAGKAAGAVCCFTPGYQAPELGRGGALSERSDIYAFGAVLFYLVTGEQPAGERGIYPVREQNPFLSERLEWIIEKCTESAPEKRYGSMEELMEDLRELSVGGKERDAGRRGMGRGDTGGRFAGNRDAGRDGAGSRGMGKKHEGKHFQSITNVLLTEGTLGSGRDIFGRSAD